jgi:hypothetical protein
MSAPGNNPENAQQRTIRLLSILAASSENLLVFQEDTPAADLLMLNDLLKEDYISGIMLPNGSGFPVRFMEARITLKGVEYLEKLERKENGLPAQIAPDEPSDDKQKKHAQNQLSAPDRKGGTESKPIFDSIFSLLAGIGVVSWMIQEWILPHNKIFLFIAIACGLAEVFYLLAHKILPHSRTVIFLSWVVYCFSLWAIHKHPGETNPGEMVKSSGSNFQSAVEINSVGWLPPELPPGCSNVSVSFGTQKIEFPVWLARIPHGDPDTNGAGTNFFKAQVTSNIVITTFDEHNAATNQNAVTYSIKELPSDFVSNAEKMPDYSPRHRHVSLNSQFWQVRAPSGKIIDGPVWPLVVSNRLFVDVEIPFINQRRRISMDTNMDLTLTNLPRLWDVNYDSNKLEVVNEDTNPVLQVIYESPSDVRVNGVYIVNTFDVYEAFDSLPTSISAKILAVDQQGTQQMDLDVFQEQVHNIVFKMNTNSVFRERFPNAKVIFKYQYWDHLGELAK